MKAGELTKYSRLILNKVLSLASTIFPTRALKVLAWGVGLLTKEHEHSILLSSVPGARDGDLYLCPPSIRPWPRLREAVRGVVVGREEAHGVPRPLQRYGRVHHQPLCAADAKVRVQEGHAAAEGKTGRHAGSKRPTTSTNSVDGSDSDRLTVTGERQAGRQRQAATLSGF